MEELVDEGVFSFSRGPLDVSSVVTRNVEAHDVDFLVLGFEIARAGLEGPEAVQAVSAWIREQDRPAPQGRHRILDPAFGYNFLWKDEEDNFGLG